MHSVRAGVALASLLIAASFSASCRDRGTTLEPVTAEEIEAHIRFLSDDLLEGRAVGSRGIAVAELYQEDLFRTFGLEPVFGSSYRQAFELRGTTPDRNAALEIVSDKARIIPALHDDFVVGSERPDLPGEVSGDLVYCGYLIQAHERAWDDVKGADLGGKVILCEINEPGNFLGGIFDGEAMTYYGRWIAKFEKAAELGAAGILIIHNDKGAAYGWDVVRSSWSGESFFLPEKNPSLAFQGWITGSAAETILGAAKLSLAELRTRAEGPAFVPIPLGLRAKVRQAPKFRTVAAQNVAGMIRGRHKDARGRTVVISAHHDHLGRDATLAGDQIYNGAVDNCSATAAMLGLAAYYAQKPEALKVNLVFAGFTAEEEGLLGSAYFARHMPFPAGSVIADINFEMTNVWGETEDVFAVGAGESDLDGVCREAAESLGLRYIPERNKELGFFLRSDQLSFARVGIPGVWLHQGVVSKTGDRDHALKKFEEYKAFKYHKVTDEIGGDWDLAGTLQIIRWAQEIVHKLEERPEPPLFRPESPFAKAQD
jgi:Zn-dependent M28 family amino/carboxypeptidase